MKQDPEHLAFPTLNFANDYERQNELFRAQLKANLKMRKRLDECGLGPALGGKAPDMVNHPPHYTRHPSGIECIQVTEHMGFNLGNAVKYLWRADLKGTPDADLQKAVWYINREIEKRKRAEKR